MAVASARRENQFEELRNGSARRGLPTAARGRTSVNPGSTVVARRGKNSHERHNRSSGTGSQESSGNTAPRGGCASFRTFDDGPTAAASDVRRQPAAISGSERPADVGDGLILHNSMPHAVRAAVTAAVFHARITESAIADISRCSAAAPATTAARGSSCADHEADSDRPAFHRATAHALKNSAEGGDD